jgi:hypothetical protein
MKKLLKGGISIHSILNFFNNNNSAEGNLKYLIKTKTTLCNLKFKI